MKNEISSAAERNKDPILKVLKDVISGENIRVFEIGSGTAQHAMYFAQNLPDIIWTTSDVSSNLVSLRTTIDEASLPNLRGPLPFEVGKDEFPKYSYDIVFTANTFHIMSWKKCKSLMKILGTRLREGSQVVIYGPFNYEGKFTSASNAEFDRILKDRDPESGIRSFEDVNANMMKNGFTLYKDFEMPANNRTLVFTRLEYIK